MLLGLRRVLVKSMYKNKEEEMKENKKDILHNHRPKLHRLGWSVRWTRYCEESTRVLLNFDNFLQ